MRLTKEEKWLADISNRGDFDEWYYLYFIERKNYPIFEELDIAEQMYICEMFDKEVLQRD